MWCTGYLDQAYCQSFKTIFFLYWYSRLLMCVCVCETQAWLFCWQSCCVMCTSGTSLTVCIFCTYILNFVDQNKNQTQESHLFISRDNSKEFFISAVHWFGKSKALNCKMLYCLLCSCAVLLLSSIFRHCFLLLIFLRK